MSETAQVGSLYETDHFVVKLATFSDPVIDEPVTGYGIWNKATGVREAEARRLEVAVVLAQQYDRGYSALTKELQAESWALLPTANTKAC